MTIQNPIHPLEKNHIHEIVDLLLKEVSDRLKDHDLSLSWTEKAKEYLADNGFDPKMGARPLRRTIQEKVEDKLSDDLLSGKFTPGDSIVLDHDKKSDDLTIEKSKKVRKSLAKKS